MYKYNKSTASSSYDLNSDEYKWVKIVEQKILNRLPMVRRVNSELTVGVQYESYRECCPGKGDSEPTPYTQVTGHGSGSLEVLFNLGAHITTVYQIPFPIPGYETDELEGVAVALFDLGPYGGVKGELAADIGGRSGECSCAKFSTTLSGSGKIGFKTQGVLGIETYIGYKDLSNKGSLSKTYSVDFNADFYGTTGLSGTVTKQIGASECSDDAITVEMTLPTLVSEVKLSVWGYNVASLGPLDIGQTIVWGPLGISNPWKLYP
jgi:hypothetical protein